MWMFDEKTRKAPGSCSSTLTIKMSPIRSSVMMLCREENRLPQRLNLIEQSLAEPTWDFECPAIADQFDDVPRPIEHRGAVPASFKMRSHSVAHLNRDRPVKIIGNLPPDFNATDLNNSHRPLLFHHALTFR
jgi:hypothetical protein